MKKVFWKSITFWGALGWAVVGVLEAFISVNPELATVAKALTAFLVAFGIRRALK